MFGERQIAKQLASSVSIRLRDPKRDEKLSNHLQSISVLSRKTTSQRPKTLTLHSLFTSLPYLALPPLPGRSYPISSSSPKTPNSHPPPPPSENLPKPRTDPLIHPPLLSASLPVQLPNPTPSSPNPSALYTAGTPQIQPFRDLIVSPSLITIFLFPSISPGL